MGVKQIAMQIMYRSVCGYNTSTVRTQAHSGGTKQEQRKLSLRVTERKHNNLALNGRRAMEVLLELMHARSCNLCCCRSTGQEGKSGTIPPASSVTEGDVTTLMGVTTNQHDVFAICAWYNME